MRDLLLFSNCPIQWRQHQSNGGTGLTRNSHSGNSDELYASIAESVKLFDDPEIWMEDGINELHSSKSNLSDFWEFHRSRQAPSDPKGTEEQTAALVSPKSAEVEEKE